MTRQNSDYGFDVQRLYIEMMLQDAETFVRCQGIWNPDLFDKKLQTSAKFINDYVEEHRVMPTVSIVNAATSQVFGEHANLKAEHYDWLMNDFETFVRHKSLEKAILESADMLEKGEYGPVEDMIKKAVQIGLTKDMGTNYFADPRSRLMKIKDKNGQVSTGWKSVDDKLFGGMNRGELNIFAAASGGGKSLFLANLGCNWALAGLNVLYLTLELSEELVSMRIDSMLTDVPTREIFKQIDDVEMKVKVIGKKSGALQVKYIPSGKNVNDIRSYVKEFEIKTDKKLDVVLVDYLDLLMPISKRISAENLFIKDKYVSEELRNFAVERNIVLVTAAQLNRGAVEEVEFDHSHISGGLSKIQTADNVFGIFTSRAMRERGRYQMFDVNCLRIRDLDDVEESQSTSTGRSIIDQIKNRTSTLTDDPQSGAPIPRPKATTDSTKVRQLLNNLNTEL